jgi:hypothetical protein
MSAESKAERRYIFIHNVCYSWGAALNLCPFLGIHLNLNILNMTLRTKKYKMLEAIPQLRYKPDHQKP